MPMTTAEFGRFVKDEASANAALTRTLGLTVQWRPGVGRPALAHRLDALMLGGTHPRSMP